MEVKTEMVKKTKFLYMCIKKNVSFKTNMYVMGLSSL